MQERDLATTAEFVVQVAREAVDESDAIERHPQIITVLKDLADWSDLNHLFGSNGHDPAAFVTALAEGLEPYRQAPLEEAPELVEGLAILSRALRQGSNGSAPA